MYYTEKEFLEKIVDYFCNVYDELKKEGIISDRDLSDPAIGNLHSWLQYALVLAGEQTGFRSPQEIKIHFEKPLCQRVYGTNKKKIVSSRVDNAFYKNSRLVGFGEVNTINDANVFLPTEVFARACDKGLVDFPKDFPVMDRDVLIHSLKHSISKPKFVVLIVTLPKRASRVPYLSIMENVGREDEQVRKMAEILRKKKNFNEACKQGWIEFRDSIRDETNTDCSLIVINEEGARSVDD